METFRIDLRGVNAYLACPEDEKPILVDAGNPWSASSIRVALEDAGYGLSDVERVLVTHYDIDHVGGLSRLASAGLDATVYAAEPDASFLDGTAKPPLRNHKGAFQRLVGVAVRRPSLPVERVEDGDKVAELEVRATPGHTPGHVVYIRGGTAFLGDAVREKNGSLEVLPSLLSYDRGEAKESVRFLAEEFSAEEAYVGHGEPVENATEKLRALVST
jgi:glyoxylase-like metal-dependent hydrolase (beta-lactamase superfamily II)